MAQKQLVLTRMTEDEFPDKIPGGKKISRSQLIAKYTELRNNWDGDWDSFKKKYGTLLGPAPDPTWKGNHFKVRFEEETIGGKKTGKLVPTTATGFNQQVRTWRVKMLTDASPGTRLNLKDTAKKFYDDQDWQAKQLHHFEGIAEAGPFIDATLKKILPGMRKNTKNYKTGQAEYDSFWQHSHRNNLIYGDKAENFGAFRYTEHIAVKDPSTAPKKKDQTTFEGSIHKEQSNLGTFNLGKASGDPNFSSETQKRLNSFSRIESRSNKIGMEFSQGKHFTIWDAMAAKRSIYVEGKLGAAAIARSTRNPDPRGQKEQPFKKLHPSIHWIKKFAEATGKPLDEARAIYRKIDSGEMVDTHAKGLERWKSKERRHGGLAEGEEKRLTAPDLKISKKDQSIQKSKDLKAQKSASALADKIGGRSNLYEKAFDFIDDVVSGNYGRAAVTAGSIAFPRIAATAGILKTTAEGITQSTTGMSLADRLKMTPEQRQTEALSYLNRGKFHNIDSTLDTVWKPFNEKHYQRRVNWITGGRRQQ